MIKHITFYSVLVLIPTRMLAVVGVVLTLANADCWPAEPVLARLSFWVSPEQMDEFKIVYQKHVMPIVKQHKLVAYTDSERATIDSVFSRSFVFKTPADYQRVRQAFLSHPDLKKIRTLLGGHQPEYPKENESMDL